VHARQVVVLVVAGGLAAGARWPKGLVVGPLIQLGIAALIVANGHPAVAQRRRNAGLAATGLAIIPALVPVGIQAAIVARWDHHFSQPANRIWCWDDKARGYGAYTQGYGSWGRVTRLHGAITRRQSDTAPRPRILVYLRDGDTLDEKLRAEVAEKIKDTGCYDQLPTPGPLPIEQGRWMVNVVARVQAPAGTDLGPVRSQLDALIREAAASKRLGGDQLTAEAMGLPTTVPDPAAWKVEYQVQKQVPLDFPSNVSSVEVGMVLVELAPPTGGSDAGPAGTPVSGP
jgi:hypothetical protein